MQDNEISNEVIADKNATSGTAKVTKMLLAGDARHKAVINQRQRMSAWAKRVTYPFAADLNLLPMARYSAFRAEFDRLKAEFDKLVDEFIEGFDDSLSNAAFRLNGMFDRADYPTASELRSKFRVELVVTDVPAGDFRNVLIQSIADDLHLHYQRQHETVLKDIAAKQKADMLSLAQSIAHGCDTVTLTREDGTTKVSRNKLHVNTVTRAFEESMTALEFNPVGDEEVKQLATDINRVLGDKSIDDLRDNLAVRAAVHDEMSDILSKFGV
jgi:hypothetical protein